LATPPLLGAARLIAAARRKGSRSSLLRSQTMHHIYRELGLQLRNKTPKRRVKAKLREDRRPATCSNETLGDGLRA
jgi:putative transposase